MRSENVITRHRIAMMKENLFLEKEKVLKKTIFVVFYCGCVKLLAKECALYNFEIAKEGCWNRKTHGA